MPSPSSTSTSQAWSGHYGLPPAATTISGPGRSRKAPTPSSRLPPKDQATHPDGSSTETATQLVSPGGLSRPGVCSDQLRSLVGLRKSDATCRGRPAPAATPVSRALIGSCSRTGP
jgi:hypothetical protein